MFVLSKGQQMVALNYISDQYLKTNVIHYREGSVLVTYRLVFAGPMPTYNQTLRLACEGQSGYQQEPPEGWAGQLTLPRGLGYMTYQIPLKSRM